MHSIRDFRKDPSLEYAELRPFQFAVIASADERAFERIHRRMARTSMLRKSGLTVGTGEEFSTYATQHAVMLCGLMLSNFQTDRRRAAKAAVTYLQMTAVSNYLVRRTRPIRSDAPNLRTYLRQSRLSPRTKLAVKLAYLPSLLTSAEQASLLHDYDCPGPYTVLMPINKIAPLLGYQTPAALSRKLYRVRAWCRSTQGHSQGASGA